MESDDWIALFVWMMMYSIPVIIFYAGACGHQWKLWYRTKGFNLGIPGPIMHLFSYAMASVIYSVGAFLVWQTGKIQMDTEDKMEHPHSYLGFMVLNIIQICISCLFGPLLWDFQAMNLLVLLSLIQFALFVATTVMAIIIWPYSFFIVVMPIMWISNIISYYKITSHVRITDGVYVVDHIRTLWNFYEFWLNQRDGKPTRKESNSSSSKSTPYEKEKDKKKGLNSQRNNRHKDKL